MAKKSTVSKKPRVSPKKTGKKKPQSPWSYADNKLALLFLIALGIVMLVVLFLVGKNQYEVNQEKQVFEKARKSIIKTTNIIDAGKISLNGCEYGSAKFEKGPLSCHVGIGLIFPTVSDSEGNQIIQTIQQLVYSNYSVDKKEIKLPFNENDSNYSDTRQQFSILGNSLSCGVSYSRVDKEQAKKGKTIITANLYVDISCYSPAKAEHYPLSN